MKVTVLLALVAGLLAGCGSSPYKDQDNFDQWAASCSGAEAANVERCARSMYTLQYRVREASRWTVRLW